MASIKIKKGTIYMALSDYAPTAKNEIGFNKNDELKVVKVVDDAWWQAVNVRTKKKGYVPSSLLALPGALQLCDWCHGAISRNGAEYLLKHLATDGMFLVRESQSQPGQYTLDVYHGSKVIHYRIGNKDGQVFFRAGTCFPTIQELIVHHEGNADGLVSGLGKVAPKAHAQTIVIGKDMDDKWEMKRELLKVGKRLGVGNYGEVFKATIHGKPVAVKSIKEDSMEMEDFMKEAHVMKKLQHPNLVKLIGVCSTELPMYIITEYIPNGDLLSYLRNPVNRKTLDTTAQYYVAAQAANGMAFLESKNTIHRDLAARNCLVGDELVVKIADFGMGRVVDEIYTARTGTKMPIKWTAPEALCYDAFSIKSDVWSFGILLWEIITFGDQPYKGVESRDLVLKLESGFRMPQPEACGDTMYSVMMYCWEMLAEDRPTFAYLRDNLEKLKGGESVVIGANGAAEPEPEEEAPPEPPARRRTSIKPDAGADEWREQFEQKQALAASSDIDLTDVMEKIRDVFGLAQRIVRYSSEETVVTDVDATIQPCQDLCKTLQGVPGLDKALIKALVSATASIAKTKKVIDKVKPVAEKLRDTVRNCNKAVKAMM